MGKINLDLTQMFPETFGDPVALKRQQMDDQIRQYQLQDAMRKNQERESQVMPNEDFNIDVGGEKIPFKSLSPEQKSAWKQNKEFEWEMERQGRITKLRANQVKLETEMQENLAKRKKLVIDSEAGTNIRPGPDFLPTIFGMNRPYEERIGEIDKNLTDQAQKFQQNQAGISLAEQQQPAGDFRTQAVPSTPKQPVVQTQPQADKPQVFNSTTDARQAGFKQGDLIDLNINGEVKRVRLK